MRIHPYDLAPISPGDRVFRPSPAWMLAAIVFCLAFVGIGVWLIVAEKATWLGVAFVAMASLVTLPLLRSFLEAMTSRSWALRLNSGRLLVRLSPALRGNGAQDRVIELGRRDVAFVRGQGRTTLTRSGSDTTHAYTSDLEIHLTPQDLQPLRDAIAEAAAPRKGRWMTVGVESRVRLTAEGTLIVAWVGQRQMLSPTLKKALAILGSEFPTRGYEHERLDFRTSDADRSKLDEQILDATERGRTIEAIKLVRLRYGYSLSEAKRFVDGLRASRTEAAQPTNMTRDA